MSPGHTSTVPGGISERAFRRGYGTYEVALDRMGADRYIEILETAIAVGHRHFDTAQVYDTEAHVAAAIDRSGVTREQVFIATKLHWSNLGYDDAVETARESRDRLGVDVIDLLYVHVPYDTYDPEETLPALDTLVDDGIIERIGISNFLPGMVLEAIDHLEHPLFAHQIEMHPCLQQERLHQLAVEEGHWIVGFSPYMRGMIREIEELQAIADRHGSTPFAVSLGWLLGLPNVGVLSHSTNENHIRSNLLGDVPDLTGRDRDEIAGIDREYRMHDGRIDPWNRSIADDYRVH